MPEKSIIFLLLKKQAKIVYNIKISVKAAKNYWII
jgi:hypothetical protein